MTKEIEDLLSRASPSRFVTSLAEFFEQRGYLSDKQLSLLRDIVSAKKQIRSLDWDYGIDHDGCCDYTGDTGGVYWGD
jgi:hypothetical protein